MSIRSKLARLHETTRVAAGAAASANEAFTPATDAPTAQDSQLQRLRKRLERSLGRSLGKATTKEAVPPDGFARTDTPGGPLFIKQVRFGRGSTLGSQPLDRARGASAQMLALLALDPKVAQTDVVNFLYLDTETTGLSHGAGTVPFLVGLSFWEQEELVVEQLLLTNFGEEGPILQHVLERLSRASALVTFNGKSFDIPLLRARAIMEKIQLTIEVPHIDLVHIARRIHRIRNIECSLSTLERELLGFERENDVGGAAIPAIYTKYLKTRKPEGIAQVLAHNELDMLAMVALVGLYGAPLAQLDGADLAGVARTLRRAGSHDQAHTVANHAATALGSIDAVKERALAEKARGNRHEALADFEAFVIQVDDPESRLELAKLYEHFVHSPDAALKMAILGTSESPARAAERRSRLERKTRRRKREGQPSLPGIVIDRDPCRTAKNR